MPTFGFDYADFSSDSEPEPAPNSSSSPRTRPMTDTRPSSPQRPVKRSRRSRNHRSNRTMPGALSSEEEMAAMAARAEGRPPPMLVEADEVAQKLSPQMGKMDLDVVVCSPGAGGPGPGSHVEGVGIHGTAGLVGVRLNGVDGRNASDRLDAWHSRAASSSESADGGVSLLTNHWPDSGQSSSPPRDASSSPSLPPIPQYDGASSQAVSASGAYTSTAPPRAAWGVCIDYARIPRAEWNLWRRCCTCHTAYFAGGEHTDACLCGHERCNACCWASDFGYAPFW